MIKEKIRSALLGTLFFAVFQPFGLNTFGWVRLVYIIGIGVTAIATCLIVEVAITYVLRMPADTSRGPAYMMRRGFVFQCLNVLLMSFNLSLFYSFFVNSDTVDNHLSWQLFGRIFLIMICISVLIGLYWRNVYMKRHYIAQLEEAELLNGMLLERARLRETHVEPQIPVECTEPIKPAKTVNLEGSTKESLQLDIDNFIYAEADGNYVSVCHLASAGVEKTMLRMSIKNVVVVVGDYPEVMQCHRAFVVNLHHVQKVEGRSSGIGLLMNHCNDTVPVSKHYVLAVKDRIKNPSKQ